ncbi:MAG: deoxyribodipyrimidine photo-lyase [Cyclobacteriaceae bacterium]|nr:MAG: deoxyribodipyrimidine photo-lyase [Cyclobacteriaceae bacterium]
MALAGDLPVVVVFIFDTAILDDLPSTDARVSHIHQQLENLNEMLARHKTTLLTYHGSVAASFEILCKELTVKSVFCNHDYEPYARARDNEIKVWLKSRNIEFRSFKDQVIYEKNEILKSNGTPYTVFTPYMKQWKASIIGEPGVLQSNFKVNGNFLKLQKKRLNDLRSIGFEPQNLKTSEACLPGAAMLSDYHKFRDYPSSNGTSRLSVHLRFGTLSIRKLVSLALEHSETWLNELIWREFYMMILWHFPYVVNRCFKKEYDFIPWKNDEHEFGRWCRGETGYPFVDAGMRELNNTGYMHNRLRMVTASFLTKHLLINWQWGEAYFAEKLLDFELSSNNGGWQWAAGCGCDAAPYFRIFNPLLQATKFDPESRYIKNWVTDLNQPGYPQPIIDHQFARKRALQTYKQTLENNKS